MAQLSLNIPQASSDEPHFGTSLLEKAASQIEGQVLDGVTNLHVPEKLESQAWVRDGEALGQAFKSQIDAIVRNTEGRLNWKGLQEFAGNLSPFQEKQHGVGGVLSSLSDTAGQLLSLADGFAQLSKPDLWKTYVCL